MPSFLPVVDGYGCFATGILALLIKAVSLRGMYLVCLLDFGQMENHLSFLIYLF